MGQEGRFDRWPLGVGEDVFRNGRVLKRRWEDVQQGEEVVEARHAYGAAPTPVKISKGNQSPKQFCIDFSQIQ